MHKSTDQFPTSNVKVVPQSSREMVSETENNLGKKYNGLGKLDSWHRQDARDKEHHTDFVNKKARINLCISLLFN